MLINLRNALMTGKRLPYDAEVEYLRVDAVGPYIVIDGVTYCNAVGTYYAFTISSGGVVTHDLIPVRLGNTGYMYDRITNKRFGNAGTGDFVLGPDVVPVEYIESHGTEYIDTGSYVDSSTDLEIDAITNNIDSTYIGLFSAGNSTPKAEVYCWVGKLQGYWGSYTTSDMAVLVGDRLNIKIGDGSIRIANLRSGVINTGSYTFTGTSTTTATLFALHRGTTYGYIGRYRLFSAKVGSKNLLPIRVGSGSTWEGAMMDVLTRRIYRNAGTGAFGYGNDLKYPIPAS